MPDTSSPPERTEELVDARRFWKRVAKAGQEECWLWTGCKSDRGYGRLRIAGKSRPATHAAVFFATGKWPAQDKVVCHRCDNPPCVNPAHLFVGSQSDNMRDAVSKGRQKFTKVPASAKPRGERHGSAKLTADDVRAIRAASPREKQRDLAARFGVAQRAVWSILKGRTWKHVKETPDG